MKKFAIFMIMVLAVYSVAVSICFFKLADDYTELSDSNEFKKELLHADADYYDAAEDLLENIDRLDTISSDLDIVETYLKAKHKVDSLEETLH